MAEAADLKSAKCRFESDWGHQKGAVHCQFDIDKTMVTERDWQVTYHLKEPLSPSQMQRLTEFQAESGGQFSFTIGVP